MKRSTPRSESNPEVTESQTHRAERGVPLQQGYMANGPGFHVWEETHGETLSSAGQLAGALSVRQARRLGRGGSSE